MVGILTNLKAANFLHTCHVVVYFGRDMNSRDDPVSHISCPTGFHHFIAKFRLTYPFNRHIKINNFSL